MDGLDARPARFLAMIGEGCEPTTALLDDIGGAARIAGGRWEPALRPVDTVALVQGDDERIRVEGSGEVIDTEITAVERALRALAVAAVRHGPVDQVTWRVSGRELELSPVTAGAA